LTLFCLFFQERRKESQITAPDPRNQFSPPKAPVDRRIRRTATDGAYNYPPRKAIMVEPQPMLITPTAIKEKSPGFEDSQETSQRKSSSYDKERMLEFDLFDMKPKKERRVSDIKRSRSRESSRSSNDSSRTMEGGSTKSKRGRRRHSSRESEKSTASSTSTTGSVRSKRSKNGASAKKVKEREEIIGAPKGDSGE